LQVGFEISPKSGGTYTNVVDFATAFEHLGWGVDQLNFTRAAPTPGARDSYAISQWPVLKHCNFSWDALAKQTHCAIHDSDLVLVHGFYFHAGVAVAAYAQRVGVPVVIVAHGGLDPWVFSYRKWWKLCWLWAYRQVLFSSPTVIIFATERERAKATRFLKGARSAVLNWPVAARPEYDKTVAKKRLRERFGLSPDAKVLLFCGRVHRMKRPLETAQAFLGADLPKWVLLIVGPVDRDVDNRDLRELCDGSKQRCILAGAQFGSELSECYGGADAFVLLSHRENFGYTVAEAASYGLPVLISSGVDLFPAVVEHGAGVAVLEETPDAFTRALTQFCIRADEDLLEMGRRGRFWVAKNLSRSSFECGLGNLVAEHVLGRG
jgi:glycosyltransferase involved in cell wall biosynthesis